jgi:hypothetical protein
MPYRHWAARCCENGFVYAGSIGINKMVLDPRIERDRIAEVIVVLERLSVARGNHKRHAESCTAGL